MKRIWIVIAIFICLFALLFVSCRKEENVQFGDKSYYLKSRLYIDQIDDSVFTNAKFDSAKLDNTTIIVPWFKYAGVEEPYWKYHLILEVYTTEKTINLDALTVDLISQKNTGEENLLAEASIDRCVIDGNHNENGITQEQIGFEYYAIIDYSILENEDKIMLKVHCSQEGEEKELVYTIDVDKHKVTWLDDLYE